jgi:hypothetical protein
VIPSIPSSCLSIAFQQLLCASKCRAGIHKLRFKVQLFCFLTTPPAPIEATTAKDQKQNNDYEYGFHNASPFSLNVECILPSFKSICCLKAFVVPGLCWQDRSVYSIENIEIATGTVTEE